ncbi:hypothetical protein DPMN_057754 [Dreissena polymorpha]|uniref:Uncharacterized protein n=1 Tax=Dreissena polymorpha TaxID=45954 RepID=A0A9D4C0Q0_DREPO|nr:hypothetical protein DPMN_057754 [Dreissena polymorpha]
MGNDQRVFTSFRTSSILCGVCSITHEAYPIIFVTFLETKFQGSVIQDTNTFTVAHTSKMVVSYSQHFTGQNLSITINQCNTTDRCKHGCMGRMYRGQNNSGNLVSARQEITDELSGNGSSLQGTSSCPSFNKESSCFSSIRQKTVVQYLNKQWRTRSSYLCMQTWKIWQLAIKENVWLKAAHIAGRLPTLQL